MLDTVEAYELKERQRQAQRLLMTRGPRNRNQRSA
jgi:hypothetical protein